MALISTLRTKMTKWVVGAIALSMGAFIVGSDLFGSGPRSIFGGSTREVGEIAGNSISIEEYNMAIQDRENNYILNFGRQPGERERATLQGQAWEILIAQNAIRPQYEKVGVVVTEDEVWDMVQGKNVEEGIKNSFKDSVGRFDRNRLIDYLKQIETMPPSSEARIRWEIFKRDLAPGRQRLKYENLIVKTSYVTSAEAEQEYHNSNDVAEAKYLFVPNYAVNDSLVKVTDKDLQDYYELNKKKYKTENTRSLSYVTFPVVASPEDSSAVREDMMKIANDLKNVSEDSIFAASNTEGNTPFTKYTTGTLPEVLKNQKQGFIVGPILETNTYRIYKLSRVGTDTAYNARASHILIRWDDTTPASKAKAKEKARGILKDIKNGASFADKAREFGTDGTASQGGDLGWFVTGQMVKPFNNAVFEAKKTGLLADVVETDFGYHIIEVTGVKNNDAYWVATIEQSIVPSDETLNVALRKADEFAAGLSGLDDFKEKVTKDGIQILESNDMTANERTFGNLDESRQIVTWLFREASIDDVSEVFNLTDTYVVAVMTGETKQGFKSLEKVKEEVRPLATKEKQKKYIADKLAGKTEPLEDLAKLFGTDASIQSISDLKLSSNSLSGPGFDPIIVGAVFSLESGKRSKPIQGENGVVVVDLQNKTIAPAVSDFSIFVTQLMQTLNGRSAYYVSEALKEAAKIEDTRYRFY